MMLTTSELGELNHFKKRHRSTITKILETAASDFNVERIQNATGEVVNKLEATRALTTTTIGDCTIIRVDRERAMEIQQCFMDVGNSLVYIFGNKVTWPLLGLGVTNSTGAGLATNIGVVVYYRDNYLFLPDDVTNSEAQRRLTKFIGDSRDGIDHCQVCMDETKFAPQCPRCLHGQCGDCSANLDGRCAVCKSKMPQVTTKECLFRTL